MEHINEASILLLSEIIPQVKDFLKEAESHRIYRSWVETDAMRVYLRKSQRPLAGVMRICLDIATVAVDEGYRQHGLFTAFMLKTHALHPWEATYLEHANPIIEQWCTKRGWTNDPRTFPPSFYLLKKQPESPPATSLLRSTPRGRRNG
jgi:hypothetical protein